MNINSLYPIVYPIVAILMALGTSQTLAKGEDGSSSSSDDVEYQQNIRPLLEEYCYGCHADGASEGSHSFDALAELKEPKLVKDAWYRVLKQLRANLMPPISEPQPSSDQRSVIESWVLRGGLQLDENNSNPGSVTLRRLNRVEYRNTIRDLLDVEFDTDSKFPADDSGHGFDNMADVLTVSPLLLEKYFDAANEVITRVVPQTARAVKREQVASSLFKRDPVETQSIDTETQPRETQPRETQSPSSDRRRSRESESSLELSYYEAATWRATQAIEIEGEYTLALQFDARESYVDNVFDLNRCRFIFSLDGQELLNEEFVRQGGKKYTYEFSRHLLAGDHELVLQIEPLSSEEPVRKLRIRIDSIEFVGPNAQEHWVRPAGYARFFPRPVPEAPDERLEYAAELIENFATRAFRRPVDAETVEQLVELATLIAQDPESTFEAGIAKAMTAILASPRFVFREEAIDPTDASPYPQLDEYSLATRLSYFLWSSMPDQRLFELAATGALRDNLDAEISRMLADTRAAALVENFAGQWLRARDIGSIQINSQAVMRRETAPDPEAESRRKRFFELAGKGDARSEEEETEYQAARLNFRSSFRNRSTIDLTDELRRAMRRETEMLFAHIFTEDRSVLEFLDADYTFLNEPLAGFYKIEGVAGSDMRKVSLPPDSLRGGVLTMGTVLATTSNPDRTSPVKRGLFVLENLLGMPTPAPPADIPPLEDSEKSSEGKKLSLRESLAVHRENSLCSSCHNRMDPLGLSLENFNALGRFRDQEFGEPIDPAATLVTGEAFGNVRELKKILTSSRQQDVYYCLTEKLLTYALGRTVDYNDLPTLDKIVDDLTTNQGRSSALIFGIIHSRPFQRTQPSPTPALAGRLSSSTSK